MVALWALRLWLHLLMRSRGQPEDPRYANFREQYGAKRYWWISLFQVFMLQGLLVLVISAPLQLAMAASKSAVFSLYDLAGLLVFCVGFAIEVIADWQLTKFRRQRQSSETVINTGLWGRSRHPNYFGESVLWWGFWFAALNLPGGWLSVFSPITGQPTTLASVS